MEYVTLFTWKNYHHYSCIALTIRLKQPWQRWLADGPGIITSRYQVIVIGERSGNMIGVQEIVSSQKMKFSSTNKDVMNLCRVVKTCLKTTSYEMFDLKTGSFILSCVSDNDFRGDFIFTTLRGTHEKELREIPVSNYSSSFLGILKRNHFGLSFSLYNDNNRIISNIR